MPARGSLQLQNGILGGAEARECCAVLDCSAVQRRPRVSPGFESQDAN